MSLTSTIQKPEEYYAVNREERFYAAVFFALLTHNENLHQFLNLIKKKSLEAIDSNPSDCQIYFEYTYLRDLWYNIGKDNNTKKQLILRTLDLKSTDELTSLEPEQFNKFFGVTRTAFSKTEIMNPATWAISKFSPNIEDDKEFKYICLFKWSFNAKPDLVIQLDGNRVICIEAKFDSLEGIYPTGINDKLIFQQRKLPYVRQTELQQYMFKNLLGYDVLPIFLTKHKNPAYSEHIINITWKEVFAIMDYNNSHPFLKKALIEQRLL